MSRLTLYWIYWIYKYMYMYISTQCVLSIQYYMVMYMYISTRCVLSIQYYMVMYMYISTQCVLSILVITHLNSLIISVQSSFYTQWKDEKQIYLFLIYDRVVWEVLMVRWVELKNCLWCLLKLQHNYDQLADKLGHNWSKRDYETLLWRKEVRRRRENENTM